MIKKSLLLLALMCGSAAAVAPANVSKTSVDDFLKVADQEEVKMHAMGDDAFMEKIDDRVAYNRHDTMKFSFAGVKTNSFRMVKDGIAVSLDVDKEHEVVTAHVEFLNETGRFELVADNGESIAVHFVQDGEKYVTSVADKETAMHNAEVLNGGVIATKEGVVALPNSAISSGLIDFEHLDFKKIELPDEKIKDLKDFDFEKIDKPFVLRTLYGVSATFQYTDDYGVTFPLRGVKVEIHNVLNGVDTVVRTGYTTETGSIGYLTLAGKVIRLEDRFIMQEAPDEGTSATLSLPSASAAICANTSSTLFCFASANSAMIRATSSSMA